MCVYAGGHTRVCLYIQARCDTPDGPSDQPTPTESHKQTAGGVFLPETKLDKPNEGQVVAVGPGARTQEGKLIPVDVSVGDTVLLPEYGGHTVKMNDEEFQLFRSEDILGKYSS